MQVKICDEPKCGRVIEDEQKNEYNLETEGGTVKITLIGEMDRCVSCTRKILARLAAGAWNELKQKREKKEKKTP